MTTFALRSASPAKTKADAVVVGVLPAEAAEPAPAVKGRGRGRAKAAPDAEPVRLAPGAEDVAEAYGRRLAPLLASIGHTGAAGEVAKVPTAGVIGAPLLVLVGLGAPDADGTVAPTAVRDAAGSAARAVTNAASVALALPADSAALVGAATEGWLLGGYRFTAYRTESATDPVAPSEVVVLSPAARRSEVTSAFDESQHRAAAVAGARDWVNTAPGDLRPPAFADSVAAAVAALNKDLGRGATKIGITVHDEAALAELGCGGILAVGGGSSAPPRLVELTYAPKNATAHVALVGKGITFDSGGLSIKPAQGMHEMKSDMAGAAAVLQATLLAARLQLPIRISTFAPMAENMLSGSAARPGDVARIYGGTTVEMQNTDAEGRMILADALVRATEVEPDAILDVATLTGAMVVALGDRVTGVLGEQATVDAVLAAADRAGETMWPMPIPEEMRQRVRSSKVADLAQVDWVRWGGGLYAAAFLREFVAGRPWAHLDIAGPSFTGGAARGHVTPGGTGVAVATLVEFLRAAGDAGA
ncbi:leucyl aminopeptidase [Nocardioides sp. TRM66260-LWL]|uniref:leucyl aminopeptidase n=1 Tax=Nocardioides sp. TRM66260-LWL TaxID=2874478 RepID=UPI001CC406CC|nr:leucyl aminopeptidase [Nocardioides sp. TRM66260-LWL]MBZ5733752.1 leucyl aminopeptidase [Nocardioides sp. TRM66260-LWL]